MNSSDPGWRALRVSDARGLAELAVGATLEVTGVVEGVHRAVHRTLGLPGGSAPGRTGGITGLVYRSIHAVTRLTGAGLAASLGVAETLAGRAGHAPASTVRRDVLLGKLNGVLGDRLAAGGNPLAVPMSLVHEGRPVDGAGARGVPAAGGRILLLIHGLCLSDHCWGGAGTGNEVSPRTDLGDFLAARLGLAPLRLRYNTGRRIAENGLELAGRLEALLDHWPAPVRELTIVGHSMGGLVARSAIHQAQRLGHRWPGALRGIVFLGTPHHGAPLERAGAWVEWLLGGTPYTRPFRALSGLRSAGIKDLRHGAVLPASAADGDAHEARHDTRAPCPLPEGVNSFAIAATRAEAGPAGSTAGVGAEAPGGDGLVPVASALGWHRDPAHDLGLPAARRAVVHATHHLGLLDSPAVNRQVLAWLEDVQAPAAADAPGAFRPRRRPRP